MARAPKLTKALLAEIIGKELSTHKDTVLLVLEKLDEVSARALAEGYEVEVGTLGYLSLRDPVKATPPQGEVRRGKRVAFREKDANRFRWPT